MKNVMIIGLMIVLIIAISGLSYLYMLNPKVTLAFETHTDAVKGPSRGFYVQVSSDDLEGISMVRDEGYSMILLAYNLKDYLNTPISEEKLNELRVALEEAEKHDLDVVFRAAYDFDGDYKDPDNIDTIIGHIEQIAPILNAFDEMILTVQAGFLGPWGEWHNSKYLSGDAREIYYRNLLIETMLDNYEVAIPLNLRQPIFILEAVEAGLDQKRLGFHNDGLLASDTDLGTYGSNRTELIDWLFIHANYGINGGEMPKLSDYTEPDVAVEEFKKIGLTYLNSGYNVEILDKWKNQTYQGENAFDYIEKHMGYRMVLDTVEVPEQLKFNRMFNIKLRWTNVGFAPLKSGYAMYLLGKQDGNIIVHEVLDYDISDVKANQGNTLEMKMVLDETVYDKEGGPIEFGLYVTDEEYRFDYLEAETLPEAFGKIEFANKDINYVEGVNYIVRYEPGNTKFKLVK